MVQSIVLGDFLPKPCVVIFISLSCELLKAKGYSSFNAVVKLKITSISFLLI